MTNGELLFWIGIGAIALAVLGGIAFGALFHHMGKKNKPPDRRRILTLHAIKLKLQHC